MVTDYENQQPLPFILSEKKKFKMWNQLEINNFT